MSEWSKFFTLYANFLMFFRDSEREENKSVEKFRNYEIWIFLPRLI